MARQNAQEKKQHRQTAPVEFRHDLVNEDAPDQRPRTGLASAGPSGDSGPELLGRRSECDVLDQLLESVRAGQSQALVLRGESGVGKSALLEYLVGKATGFRIARAAGAECEMELPFAGLHQLCAPMLGRLSALPAPQRDALATVFGLNGHEAPDRFLVGLAGLGLLSGAAERRPLLCVVDDGQWLDRASAEALAFVARRVPAEPIALVFAVRDPTETRELAGLPELVVGGLSDVDARTMLDSTIRGLIDERVRDRIVAEARGNPLALLELPGGLTPAELAGGVGRPDTMPIGLRDTPAVTEADPLGTRVVVADDDVLMREGVASLLERSGYGVVGQAGDGSELMGLVRKQQPELAVVDIRMPPAHRTEGLDAAQAIREEFPETALVILSAHVEVEHATTLLATGGGTGYLLKSRVTDVDEFLDAVARVSRGGSVVDPTLVQELVAARNVEDPLGELTRRERDVLALMAEGRSNAGIGRRLWITEGTVEKHVHSIMTKLRLAETDDDHRRVLAVVTFLDVHQTD